MTRLILASASAGRLEVLRHAGVDPLVIVSGIDEDAVIAAHTGAQPGGVVCALAQAKAAGVANAVPTDIATDCVVIGCDSMLYLDGELRGKPGSVEAARQQWHTMAGRSGELYTGHCLLRMSDGAVTNRIAEADATTVQFGMPTAEELDTYLASGEPLGVAGAFTLDGLGGWFIDRVDGAPSNVIGLSLPKVRAMLHASGLGISALWAANRWTPAG